MFIIPFAYLHRKFPPKEHLSFFFFVSQEVRLTNEASLAGLSSLLTDLKLPVAFAILPSVLFQFVVLFFSSIMQH